MARRFNEIKEITINKGTPIINDFIDDVVHNVNFDMFAQYDKYRESFLQIADKYLNKLQDMYETEQITKSELDENLYEISGFFVNPVNEKCVHEINSLDFNSNSYIEDIKSAVTKYENTIQSICEMEDVPYEQFVKSTSNIGKFANEKINEKENDIISKNLDANDKIERDEDLYDLDDDVSDNEDELENKNVNINEWKEVLSRDAVAFDNTYETNKIGKKEIKEDDLEI